MIFECPKCSESVEADAEMIGTQARCPHCRKKVTVPMPDARVRQTRANEVVISAPADVATHCVAEAIKALGSVKRRDYQSVLGRIKYGLQSVKISVSLVERLHGETTAVIQASSDDVWGAGAKNATERLVETLLNLDNPGYRPDRLGIHPAALIGLLIGFAILVMWAMKHLF